MNNLNIPTHFLIQCRLFGEIIKEAEEKPNDMEFGNSVRKIINDYKEGKYNPPPDIEFDEENKK